MSKFDAAIVHLRILAGIKPIREKEKFSIKYGDGSEVDVRQDDILATIRVLEEAAKVDCVESAIKLLKHSSELKYCKVIHLLEAALPDKEA
jgi:hypothetical protein